MKKKLTAGLMALTAFSPSCSTHSPELNPEAKIQFVQESAVPFEGRDFDSDQAEAVLDLLRTELDYQELPRTIDNYTAWTEGPMQYHVVSLVENYPLWSRIADIQKALQYVSRNFSSVDIPVVTTANTVEKVNKTIRPSVISNRYMVILPPGKYPQIIENDLLSHPDIRPAGVTLTFESADSSVSFVQFTRDGVPGTDGNFSKALTTELCQQNIRATSGESYDQESLCNSVGRAVLAVLNGWDYQTYLDKSEFTEPSQLPSNTDLYIFTISKQMYSALQSQLA